MHLPHALPSSHCSELMAAKLRVKGDASVLKLHANDSPDLTESEYAVPSPENVLDSLSQLAAFSRLVEEGGPSDFCTLASSVDGESKL